MQKKLLIPLFALFLILHSSYYTRASSPTPSPISDDQVTQNLKKRLQDSLNNSNSTSTPTTKAYLGVVKDVIKDTVVIEDKDGKKDIQLEDDTTIIRSPGNIIIKSDSIRLGDYMIAIGYPGESEVLLGRRLVVSIDPIKSPAKLSDLGTIVKIAKASLTLQVGDQEKVINLTSKTIFKSPVAIIELSDLAVGDKLIYTAKLGDDNGETATLIMRIQTASLEE